MAYMACMAKAQQLGRHLGNGMGKVERLWNRGRNE